MRRNLCAVVVVIAGTLGSSGTNVAAQIPDTIRGRVSGSAQVTIRLVPTRAVMHLLIENTATTSAEAVTLTAQAAQSVVDTLRRAGGAEDVILVEYGVVPTPMTQPTPAGAPRSSYVSRAAVRFTASLTRIQQLTAAAYTRGASVSAPPSFQHDGLDTAMARAIEEGAARARQRAEAIARGLGGRLGALMHIDMHPMYNSTDYQPQQGFPAPQGHDYQPRPIPEIRHTVNMTASWVFIPR